MSRSGPIVLGCPYHPASTCTTSARNGQAPVRNCRICVLRPFLCAIFSRLFACGSRAARRTLALPWLTRARASLAGECHLKDYMRVECCTSCRAAAALQEVTFFAHPFFAHPFFAHPPISPMRRTPILPISHVSCFARALFSPTQPPSPEASYQSHERRSLYRFSLYRFSLYRRSLDRMPRTRPQGGIVRSSHFGICTNGEFSECGNYFLPRQSLNYFLPRRSLTPSLGPSLTRCALSIARRVQVVHDARHACDNLPRRT